MSTSEPNPMNNLQQILEMGQQMQARLEKLQSDLASKTVTTTSGGGMVTAVADGRGRLRSLKIDPSVVDGGDVEMLEDLVLAAVAEAQSRAEAVHEEEMRKLSGGMSLPFPFGGAG